MPETISGTEWKKRAREADAQDELARFREQFYALPGVIYLDGNSLGLLSRPAEAAVLRVLDEWKTQAIGGWTEANPGWFFMAEELARQIAPLVGADADEVLIANSTTVNLHQLLATLYDANAPRKTILTDELNFSSDLYALRSHLTLRGVSPETHLKLAPSADGLTLNENDLIAAMTDDVQIAVFPSVLYRSGQRMDMARLARAARERGILFGLDCAHSIGAMPHELDQWGVDFAFWCHYKYLNCGPGSAAGLYLNRRHFGKSPGLAGWFSNRKQTQFDMAPELDAAPDAAALHIGTPNILSMAPLGGSLEMVAEAGIEKIRAKSLRLTDFLMELADAELAEFGFQVGTPREPERRGGHVALLHPDAAAISRALRRAGVVPDYRPPNILRLAPTPLYNSFADCREAAQRLKNVMERKAYTDDASERGLVP